MQGALPDGDAEADALLRGVKSKAMYGRVREEVDRMKVYRRILPRFKCCGSAWVLMRIRIKGFGNQKF